MEAVRFLSNSATNNHFQELKQLLEEADKIYLATAFLKKSGLADLLPSIKTFLKEGKEISIIAGQHFGLTEPEAFLTLFRLFKPYEKASLYLAKAEKPTAVFHPKLLLAAKGRKGTILCGSANFTAGGLISNQEASVLVETTIHSSAWKEAKDYFDTLISAENGIPATLLSIKQYEDYYVQEKSIRRKLKAVPSKKKALGFDVKSLKKYLKDYRDADYKAKFKDRVADYQEAKVLLDEIADTKRLLTADFEEIIDLLVGKERQQGYWYSGSMHRNKRDVYGHKKEFQQLVNTVRNRGKLPISTLFDDCKKQIQLIKGAGPNYLAEILMTYYPSECANLNQNPITVLAKEAGVHLKKHASSFNGEDYEQYCELVSEICAELELENMLEADSFFNDIYWRL